MSEDLFASQTQMEEAELSQEKDSQEEEEIDVSVEIGRNTLSQELEDEQRTLGTISQDWEEEEDYEDVAGMPPPSKRHTAEQRETPRRSSSTSTRPRVPRRFLTTRRRRSKKKSGESSSDEGEASQVIGGSKPSSSRGLNLTPCQERDVVEWFQQHEIFYKKKLRCYKDTAKKGRLLTEKAAELDINGECKNIFIFFL